MRYFYFLGALLCTALLSLTATAQSLRPATLVHDVAEESGFEESFNLFTLEKSAPVVDELERVGADYEVLSLQSATLATLQRSAARTRGALVALAVGRVAEIRTPGLLQDIAT